MTTDDTDQQMIYEEFSGNIIDAAMQVLNELKPGLDEKLYERAMIIELKRRGHIVSVRHSFPVYYGGELIGNLVPDLGMAANRRLPISMLNSSYPCYPCNPWFSSFENGRRHQLA